MAVYHVNVNSLPPLFINRPCEDNDGIIPIYSDSRLDERSYGILEGKKKDLILQQYGIEQLHSSKKDNVNVIDALIKVYNSFISEKMDDYNSSLYYENPSYIFTCYEENKMI